MTRYLFPERDMDAVEDDEDTEEIRENRGDDDDDHEVPVRYEWEIRRNRTSNDAFANKENHDASLKRRTSTTTEKSLYSHVRGLVQCGLFLSETIWKLVLFI